MQEIIQEKEGENINNGHQTRTEPSKRIAKACLPCRRDHLSCNNARPCIRCSCKGRECTEAESKPRGPKRKRKEIESDISAENSVEESIWEDFEKKYSLDGEWLSFLDQYLGEDEGVEGINEESEEPSPLDLAVPEESLFQELDSRLKMKGSKEICHRINSRISQVKKFANNYQKKQLRLEFEKDLDQMKSSSSKMNIPIILFGRGARVLFYNEAFRDATGFDFEFPTPVGDFRFVRMLDDKTLHEVHCTNMIARLYLSDAKGFPMRFGFNCPNGNVEGNGIITPLKHIMGFPHLFVFHFIPTPSKNNGIGPIFQSKT